MNEILKKLSTKPRQVKSPKTNLLVSFPNGRIFFNDVAMDTFEEVIRLTCKVPCLSYPKIL